MNNTNLQIRLFVLIMAVNFIILAVFFRKLPPVVPLFFSLPWGEEQLVSSSFLLILPFSQVVIFIINYLLAKTLLREQILYVQMIAWGLVFISILGLISLGNILLLVL